MYLAGIYFVMGFIALVVGVILVIRHKDVFFPKR